MNKLPDMPTLESVLYALSQLDGEEAYVNHIRLYIKLQEDTLKQSNTKSARLITTDKTKKDINTESLKIPNVTQDVTDDVEAEAPPPSSKKTTIVVIEDDISIGIMIKAIAESDGFLALVAETGRDGIALAEEHIPDLIICDVHLPGMHGLQVVKTIKAHPQLMDIPILMLTADIFKGEESFEMGVSEYILKPVRKNQLLGYINKYISSTES